MARYTAQKIAEPLMIRCIKCDSYAVNISRPNDCYKCRCCGELLFNARQVQILLDTGCKTVGEKIPLSIITGRKKGIK